MDEKFQDAESIGKKVKEIYQKERIPLNLQKHMIIVDAVVKLIYKHLNKHLKGAININILSATAKLHDLGNVVKYNFDTVRGLAILSSDIDPKHYQGPVRDNLKTEYAPYETDEYMKVTAGTVDKYITTEMIKKYMPDNTSDRSKIISLIRFNMLKEIDYINKYGDPELVILYIADKLVTPDGLSTLGKRKEDMISRYRHDRKADIVPENLEETNRLWNETYRLAEQLFNVTEWDKIDFASTGDSQKDFDNQLQARINSNSIKSEIDPDFQHLF